jgi:hypothetical protein
MKTARRAGASSLATLSACLVAFVVAHAVSPKWARSAGLDFWNMSEARELQQQEDERRRDIESHADDLLQQIAAGDTVVQAVIENRMDWNTAVDQIVEINRDRDGFQIALEGLYRPVKDERELGACHLRAKIRLKLADEPSHLNEVMNRINAR